MVSLLTVVAAQLGTHLGSPPDPSKPLSIKTVVGSKFLYKPRQYRLAPDQPYRDQARYIGQHGYHSEHLLEALGDGRFLHHYH